MTRLAFWLAFPELTVPHRLLLLCAIALIFNYSNFHRHSYRGSCHAFRSYYDGRPSILHPHLHLPHPHDLRGLPHHVFAEMMRLNCCLP
jgi:hypothetical protein